MNKKITNTTFFALLYAMCSATVFGQETKSGPEKIVQPAGVEQSEEVTDPSDDPVKSEPIISAPSAESTLEACGDKVDNDNDGHVDCDDQDCSIYAVCVQSSSTIKNEPVAPAPLPVEAGKLCRDKIDNDGDGFTDCHDTKCQSSNYCQKIMSEYPDTTKEPMGFFVSASFGLALPNFKWKETRVDSDYGSNVPFDPDLGGMFNLKAGAAPLRWLGFGVNFNSGGTFATNREEFTSISDLPENYKYDGYKVFGHLGAFVRLQYPAKRVVPYLDIAGGYSFTRYKWKIYDGDNTWSDIDSNWDDSQNNDVAHDTKYRQSGHFTFALEPGIDVYVINQVFAVGAKAWIPVFASSNRSMDNIGLLFNFTYTPSWRGEKQLKSEFQKN
ncbi:MAG: hypothetical protein JXR91_06640 [Deltaproteobacteria bacterium]|nr:hypothetical protein [Deltaproteobacteria bacterium]